MATRVLLSAVLCLTFAAGAGCGGDSTPAQQDAGLMHDLGAQQDVGPVTRHLALLYTSDEHSRLFAYYPEIDDFPLPTTAGSGALIGGVARRAVLLAQERAAAAADGVDTLTVSAGDQTQGALPQVNYTTTAADFTLLKTMGYDVMCPGNHEFDRGPAAYAAAITVAQAKGGLAPIVVSNIHFSASDPADDSLAALYGEGTSDQPIKRYHVVTTASGIKVGFFGLVGVGASYDAPLKVPVSFSGAEAEEGETDLVLPKIYADIAPTVQALRETEQVDVVVALSHSGVDPNDPSAGEDYRIASNVAGIDLIISGHTHDALQAPHLATDPDGRQVPIVQAGQFGEYLGRVELVLEPGARPVLVTDPTKTRLIPIDDTIVPNDATVNTALTNVIRDLEETHGAGGVSFLEAALSRIEGTTVTDDPAVVGDLYYRVMAHTNFDVPGRLLYQESNGFNLVNDGMLAAAETYGGPTAMAASASGVIRADLFKGLTGDLTFADLYTVLPLGFNPVDGSIGYPLVRFYLMLVELKAAFELSARQASPSFFIVPSGMKVWYDTSRPEQDMSNPFEMFNAQNGRVTKITIDTNHADGLEDEDVTLFDLGRPAGLEWQSSLGDSDTLYSLATNLYVASFASAAGVTIKNAAGEEVPVTDVIVKRGDGSDVKDYEAFVAYVWSQAAANGGELPSRYNGATSEGTVPRRMFCTGPLCE